MPKVIDHDQRRAEIIDITWQLLVENGTEAATMREIARRAGYANGALKHYFTSKDHIIKAAYERALNRISENLQPHVEGLTGITAIRTAMLHTLPILDEDVTAARVLLSYLERCAFNPDLDEQYGAHVARWRTRFKQWLTEGRDAGEVVTDVSDELLIAEIIQMNIGATIMCVVTPDSISPSLLRTQVDMFIDRLRQAD